MQEIHETRKSKSKAIITCCLTIKRKDTNSMLVHVLPYLRKQISFGEAFTILKPFASARGYRQCSSEDELTCPL